MEQVLETGGQVIGFASPLGLLFLLLRILLIERPAQKAASKETLEGRLTKIRDEADERERRLRDEADERERRHREELDAMGRKLNECHQNCIEALANTAAAKLEVAAANRRADHWERIATGGVS